MPDLGSLVKPCRNMIFNKQSSGKPNSLVSIDWKIESSPTIVIGDEEQTLPSFLSGELSVKVKEDVLEVESFGGALSIHTTQKKPLKNRCANCKDQYAELHSWTFLKQATALRKGNHQFPFSTLIPDDLPASMETPLLSVSYEFYAEIRFKSKDRPSDAARIVTFKRTLTVKRSLCIPHYPAHYTREFASAGMRIDSCIDPIFRPTGANKVSLSMKGLTRSSGDGSNTEAWRLMKGSWKLDEKIQTRAKPCKKHSVICDASNADLARTKTRILGEKSLYDGWTPINEDGTSDMEFSFEVKRRSSDLEPSCMYDTKSSDGTEVTHSLSLELIFVKEHYPEGKPELAIRTGVGRILRLDYRVALVDDSLTGPGCIIENLPSYNDVCPSPPRYSEEEVPVESENLTAVAVA